MKEAISKDRRQDHSNQLQKKIIKSQALTKFYRVFIH
jgi:hypothetical protein